MKIDTSRIIYRNKNWSVELDFEIRKKSASSFFFLNKILIIFKFSKFSKKRLKLYQNIITNIRIYIENITVDIFIEIKICRVKF